MGAVDIIPSTIAQSLEDASLQVSTASEMEQQSTRTRVVNSLLPVLCGYCYFRF